jgi:PAS domain S-box-containing protein
MPNMKVFKKVDVLIVDDREEGLMALEASIRLPNVTLVKAQSGQEALDLLHKHTFAVILLDVQMPGLDGFQTAERIRKEHGYKDTPIIFVTAINKEDRYVYKGYDVGAVDYIFKPFDAHVLSSKVAVFVDLFLKSQILEEQADLIQESERKERFQRLAELEIESLKRYRNLADSIPHMVWKAKNDGMFDYFNRIWIDYTGLSQEKSIGLGWQSAIHEDDLNEFLKTWIHSMNTNKAFETEARIKKSSGEMRWHWVRAIPEMSGNMVSAWIGTCSDIHDRKLAEMKIVEAERLAVSANIAKTSFLANMSHEIRTPMNAILGFSELMLAPDQSEDERKHCISTIHRSGQQLISIIDDILDISKVEAGHLEIEIIDVNLPTLLRDLCALMHVQSSSKNLDLQFNLVSDIPEFIKSDPTRIRQILVNVIGNAIKFTKRGSVVLEVGWNQVSKKLLFKVKDTGIGIDPEHEKKLFHPFIQVDNSTTRKFGGTGLGLFLSRKLSQALGGNIILETSKLGQGTTFSIEVKVEPVLNTKYVSEIFENKSEPAKPSHETFEGVLNGLKVLLVEDSKDNQDIISFFLTKAGATVELADNGIEGVEKTLKGNYNVVLMDIQMPKMDGYQATIKLRQEGYKGPIIALTAHALKEERERCLEAGYSEHMTKPINRKLLIERVAEFAAVSGE